MLVFVELVPCGGDAPVTHVLPAARAELVEERDGVPALNRREQGAVRGAEMLVAVAARAGVDDCVGVACGVAVGVARIDAAEVSQQRDEAAVALTDAVAYRVRALYLGPRKRAFKVQGCRFKVSNVPARFGL